MNPENILKGRMAETLVEELLRQSGNRIYRFGYEAIVQNLAELSQEFDRYSQVGEQIRAIPDFIVINKKGKPIFVEVKFRARLDLKLHRESIKIVERVDKFWRAKIIFANCWQQPYFQISEPPYIDRQGKLLLKPLMQDDDLKIDKNIYDTYEELVRRYLTPTLIPPVAKRR